jgi:CBS domain-containing protein
MEHVPEPGARGARAAGPIQPPPRRRLTVADVMCTRLVTVTPDSGFKQMAALMRGHRISGLPVVDDDGRPVGVVSETDLLAKERRTPLPLLTWLRPGRTRDHLRAQGTTAGEVMTAPAETVPLHTTVVAAARRLQDTGVRRLLVVDGDGRLAAW